MNPKQLAEKIQKLEKNVELNLSMQMGLKIGEKLVKMESNLDAINKKICEMEERKADKSTEGMLLNKKSEIGGKFADQEMEGMEKIICGLKEENGQLKAEIVGIKGQNSNLLEENCALKQKIAKMKAWMNKLQSSIRRRKLSSELVNELFASLPLENAFALLATMANGLLAKNVQKMLKSLKMAIKNNKWNLGDCSPNITISEEGLFLKHSGKIDESCVRAILPVPLFIFSAAKKQIIVIAFYFEIEMINLPNAEICIGFCSKQFPLDGVYLGNVQNSIGIADSEYICSIEFDEYWTRIAHCDDDDHAFNEGATKCYQKHCLKSCNTSSTTENYLTIKLEDRNGTGHMCFENILEPNGNGAKTGKRFVLSDEESDFYCPSSNSYKKAYLKFEPRENENGYKTLELFGKKCKFKLPKDNIIKMNMNGEMHNSHGEVIECQELLEFDTSQYVQEFENAQKFGVHWADYDFFFLLGKLLLSSNASEIEAHGGIQIEDQCTVVEQDVKAAIIDNNNNPKEFMVRNGYVYNESGNGNKTKMEETIQKIFSALMDSDDYYTQNSLYESKDWFFSFTVGEFRYIPVEAALVNEHGVVRMIFHKCNNASFAIVVKNASSATVKDVKPENDWSLDFVNLTIKMDVGRCNEYSLEMFDIDKGENNYNAIRGNSNKKDSKIFEINKLNKNTVQVGIFKRTGRYVSSIEIESHRYFYGHTDPPFPMRPVMAEELNNFDRVREWGRYLTPHSMIYKNAQEHTLAVKFERVSIQEISKYFDLGVRQQFPVEIIPVLYQQMYECFQEGENKYAYRIFTSRFLASQKIKLLIDGEMKEPMFTQYTKTFIWDGNRYDVPSDLSVVDLLPSNASEIETKEDQCTVVEQDVRVAIIDNNPMEFMVRNGYIYSETGNANEAKMKETIGKIHTALIYSGDDIKKSLESNDWFFSFMPGEFRYVPVEAALVNEYGVVRMIFHKCNNASFAIVVKNASSSAEDVKPENDWSLDFVNLTIKMDVGRCNEYSLEMFDIDKGENNYNAIDKSIFRVSGQMSNNIFEISKLNKNTVQVGILKRTGRYVSPIEIESHRYFYGHTDPPFPIRPVMVEELNNFNRVREWGRYITPHDKIYKNAQEHTLAMYECFQEGEDKYAYRIFTSRFMANQKIKLLIDGEMKEPMFTQYTKTFIWNGNHYDVPSDLSIVDLWKTG